MRGKFHPMLYVLLPLIAIGLVFYVISDPTQLLIPVIVFGLVFLLYKFPPGRLAARKPAPRKPERVQSKPRSRKTMPFRVIEGGKDDDNLPKYH